LIATTVGENHMKQAMEWYRRLSCGEYVSMASLSFTLENGLEQLKLSFPNVSLARYEDNLHVTELEPIMAYIHSGISSYDLKEDELEKLKQELQAELNQKGEIFISKDSGLFEAVK
jgi:hypothetical protein